MPISLTSYGAAECVAGSKHLLDVNGYKVLIDIGHEYKDERPPFAFDPKTLDALVITHAHADHMGRLKDLVDNGFNGPMYCHPATKGLCRVQLEGELIGGRFRGGQRPTGAEIHEAKMAIDDILAKMVVTPYHQQRHLTPDLSRYTLDAGHILGSEQNILTSGNVTIGFSGDLGRTDIDAPITRQPEKLPKHLDYFVLEGTYGAKRHNPIDTLREELSEWIQKAHQSGGKLVFPAFSMQRTQNLLMYLFQLYDQKKIPKNMRIFFDSPSAKKINGVMLEHRGCFDDDALDAFNNPKYNPFHFPALHYTRNKRESLALMTRPGADIIVTASGMCHGGRIEDYLADVLIGKQNILVLTGYQSPRTPGFHLANGAKDLTLRGQKVPVHATIGRIHGFSGHSDCDESIRHLKHSNDPEKREDFKAIFLVHGEKQNLYDLKGELHKAGFKNVIVAEQGKKYDLTI